MVQTLLIQLLLNASPPQFYWSLRKQRIVTVFSVYNIMLCFTEWAPKVAFSDINWDIISTFGDPQAYKFTFIENIVITTL